MAGSIMGEAFEGMWWRASGERQRRTTMERSSGMPGHPQRILLTPTAFIGERWNGEMRALERDEVDDPIPWLRVTVALEGEVTLGALFAVVGSYPELMDFLARYA